MIAVYDGSFIIRGDEVKMNSFSMFEVPLDITLLNPATDIANIVEIAKVSPGRNG